MRRPVMYLAGLLLATGASLALAGPASAAPSNCHHDSAAAVAHAAAHAHGLRSDDWYPGYSDDDSYTVNDVHSSSFDNGNTYNGLNLLSGNATGLGLLGTGILG